jgi:hypothetical protein
MTHADITVDIFRSAGRMLELGISARVPRLPRDTHVRRELERVAQRDRAVRRALNASVAEAERQRQLQPRVLRRDFGEILEIR